jgi:hypothetical protein
MAMVVYNRLLNVPVEAWRIIRAEMEKAGREGPVFPVERLVAAMAVVGRLLASFRRVT